METFKKHVGHAFASNSESDALRHEAFLRTLPVDFAMKSLTKAKFDYDPRLKPDDIVGLIKGYESCYRIRDKQHHDSEQVFLRKEGTKFLSLHFSPGKVWLELYSSDDKSEAAIDEILKGFESARFKNKEKDGVWADFSYISADEGPRSVAQFLKCPKWSEIRGNYPVATQKEIEWVMGLEEPGKRGHLMIWNGPPGTGKTYGIRAIMMQWREKFKFVVVTDPERFASDSSYYYSLASNANHEYDDEGVPKDEDEKAKRTLFIMEDTADLIIQESRQYHFDKIGKLLNITDGLFGQGREDIFLFTFNEKVDKIDPAFLRSGRCIMHHEFGTFNMVEAEAWLAAHGKKFHKDEFDACMKHGEMTLAEMYAILLGKKEVVRSILKIVE